MSSHKNKYLFQIIPENCFLSNILQIHDYFGRSDQIISAKANSFRGQERLESSLEGNNNNHYLNLFFIWPWQCFRYPSYLIVILHCACLIIFLRLTFFSLMLEPRILTSLYVMNVIKNLSLR